MKKLILATLLSVLSVGAINAHQTISVYGKGFCVTGFEDKASRTWEEAGFNLVGARSCVIERINNATVHTYFKAPVKKAKAEWKHGKCKPVSQSFRYGDSHETLRSYDVETSRLNDGNLIFVFRYATAPRVSNKMFDFMEITTMPQEKNISSIYCVYKINE